MVDDSYDEKVRFEPKLNDSYDGKVSYEPNVNDSYDGKVSYDPKVNDGYDAKVSFCTEGPMVEESSDAKESVLNKGWRQL